MARQGLARGLSVAGIILAAAAGGALLPGSTPVRAADVTIAPAPVEVPPARITAARAAPPPPSTPTTAVPTTTVGTDPAPTTESSTSSSAARPPAIAPSPARRLVIPAIDVDADVLPVDSQPTGQRNEWGGEIYAQIEFPVDDAVRQWVRRGDPNSLPAKKSADNVKAFDRTILYGHASDIGNHLVFQDLAALKPGDKVRVDTDLGRFTYAVTTVLTREKAHLDTLAELYEYPSPGSKELALVACLPDSTSNVVVLAALTSARATS